MVEIRPGIHMNIAIPQTDNDPEIPHVWSQVVLSPPSPRLYGCRPRREWVPTVWNKTGQFLGDHGTVTRLVTRLVQDPPVRKRSVTQLSAICRPGV